NSAIENVVDLAADYQFHLRAKRAKDMAAGAVLVISGFAVIVALAIFLVFMAEQVLQNGQKTTRIWFPITYLCP
ncbi:diacylglycerol kinase family protein, partial [Lactococcus petauri]|uniref:diacylglycerol kinase family protein n=1 Tax=Lactococcus petauri TaxID=1940789 RepID=UPI0023EC8F05